MDEMHLSSISSVDKNVVQNNPAQASNEAVAQKASEQRTAETKDSDQASKRNKFENSIKDVELRFIPDNDTNEVTVFVVDRTSKSVLRTIPPEEMGKLNAGDLLDFTA